MCLLWYHDISRDLLTEIPCTSQLQDGITHVQETPRIDFDSMTMQWTAPAVGTGSIRFALAYSCSVICANVVLAWSRVTSLGQYTVHVAQYALSQPAQLMTCDIICIL